VFPEWPPKDAGLAGDEDLRRLQLRWARDDLWMRRILFAMTIVVTVAGVIMFLVAPSKTIGSAGGAVSLVMLSVARFFSRHVRH
jgi:hypothetical protein